MSRDEQREKLAKEMANAMRRRTEHRTRCNNPDKTDLHWFELDNARAALDAIGAAGFCVVAPGVSESMADAGWEKMREIEKRDGSMPSDACLEIWKAMLAVGGKER